MIANFTTLTWARVETLGVSGGPAGRNLHSFVAVGSLSSEMRVMVRSEKTV